MRREEEEVTVERQSQSAKDEERAHGRGVVTGMGETGREREKAVGP